VVPVWGGFQIDLHHADGSEILSGGNPKPLSAPVRQANSRVLSVAALRRALHTAQQSDPSMPAQTGGASFAIEMLNLPWRQRFEGTKDQRGGGGQQSVGFLSSISIAARVLDSGTTLAVQTAFEQSVVHKAGPEVKK
jgi:hypothetical protein